MLLSSLDNKYLNTKGEKGLLHSKEDIKLLSSPTLGHGA